ncbi:hypothetical protein PM082_022915 [Marasmius tenuissimus]|nr:hypothetical protein PM082_022915 [Marasmius tenuissimus]
MPPSHQCLMTVTHSGLSASTTIAHNVHLSEKSNPAEQNGFLDNGWGNSHEEAWTDPRHRYRGAQHYLLSFWWPS